MPPLVTKPATPAQERQRIWAGMRRALKHVPKARYDGYVLALLDLSRLMKEGEDAENRQAESSQADLFPRRMA